MSEPSPAAQAIRQAIDAVFTRSTVPPTTEEVAAAVLRAAADPMKHHWDGAECVDYLQATAAELEGAR